LQIFFRSRGRNILLAALAFACTWLLFHRLHGWVQRVSLLRRKRRTFSARLFNVVYTFLTVFGATVSFLLVLYLFEDWVLLTLALLILFGIAWSSKHTLPDYVKEAVLLLNLGSVREGDRVIYNGVPWLVRSLGFDTHLANSELMGGNLHLPLRDFLDLRSRPFEPDEPWFPTRMGDWVLLDNDTLGKVILQTPEVVRVVLLGGSRRTFSLQDFLTQSLTVLSTGFRLAVQFGLDYQHQARITHEIPATLESSLREALAREGYAKDIVNLKVEFAEAGASSLNLCVLADFAGTAASSYHVLRHAIQCICVDACNVYGWVIPFPQVTLHMAPTSGEASLPSRDGSQPNEEPARDHS
jgi:small-conductance mechanosensitive channel